MTHSYPDLATLQQLEQQENFQEVVKLLESTELEESPEPYQAIYAFALLQIDKKQESEKLFFKLLENNKIDARIYLGLSILSSRRQQKNERLKYIEKGLESNPNSYIEGRLTCSKACALADLNQGETAANLLEKALEALPPEAIRLKALHLYALQSVYATLDDFQKQEKYARKALHLYETLEMHKTEISIMMDLGYRLYYKNQPEEAFALIDQTIDLAMQFDAEQLPEALLQRIELNLLEERYTQVEEDLKVLKDSQKKRKSSRLRLITQVYEAECLWRQSKITQLDFENRLLSLEPSTDFEEVVVYFCKGLIAFLRKDLKTAKTSFQSCVQGEVHWFDSFRIRSQGFLAAIEWKEQNILGSETSQLIGLLSKIGGELALQIDIPILKDYYKHCKDISDPLIAILSQSYLKRYPTLSIYTLGQDKIYINNYLIEPKLSRARLLLVYLAIKGSTSRDRIFEDVLYDIKDKNNYFKQLTRSLKAAFRDFLPDEGSILSKEGEYYRIRDNINIEIDIQIIEKAFISNDNIQHEKAIDLFKDLFMINFDRDWINEARQLSETHYISILLQLAKYHLKNHQPREAHTLYYEATKYDPIHSKAWEGAILSLLAANDPAAAKYIAKLCLKTIRKELKDGFDIDDDWKFLKLIKDIDDD